MYTGIIDHCGEIISIKAQGNQARLVIASQFSEIQLGESIALDGFCVTVSEITAEGFCCDVSPESLKRTIASTYRLGQKVNLERSLRVGDRLGGHFVLGHVDQTVMVNRIFKQQGYITMSFADIREDCFPYLSLKGSVTINGVSLTINDLSDKEFSIMLIPHTQLITNLTELKLYSRVNIEYDQMAKIIQQQVKHYLNNTQSV